MGINVSGIEAAEHVFDAAPKAPRETQPENKPSQTPPIPGDSAGRSDRSSDTYNSDNVRQRTEDSNEDGAPKDADIHDGVPLTAEEEKEKLAALQEKELQKSIDEMSKPERVMRKDVLLDTQKQLSVEIAKLRAEGGEKSLGLISSYEKDIEDAKREVLLLEKQIKKDEGAMARITSSSGFQMATGLGGLLVGVVCLLPMFQGMGGGKSAAAESGSAPPPQQPTPGMNPPMMYSQPPLYNPYTGGPMPTGQPMQ